MHPSRIIYEDAPAFIPVPPELQHQRIEAVLRPLMDAPAAVLVAPGQEAQGRGDVIAPTGARILPSLENFRATLPLQTVTAGDLCRAMRDEDRY